MPRNRIIKAEFWSDEKIGRLPIGARLLFISMLNFADDFGVVSASTRRRLGESFENDESITEQNVIDWSKNIEEVGLIEKFNAEEKDWYFIKKWEKHQKIDRRSQRRNPGFNGESLPLVDTLDESLVESVDEALATPSQPKQKQKQKENIKKNNNKQEYSSSQSASPSQSPPEKKNVVVNFKNFDFSAYGLDQGKARHVHSRLLFYQVKEKQDRQHMTD